MSEKQDRGPTYRAADLSDRNATPADGLKAGDRVELRSGGPWMTVLDVGRDTGAVWCRWMGTDGTLREATFPAAAVKSVPPGALPHGVYAGLYQNG